ncbi:hypothetical protein Tco_0942050 [Tanacetum coccineum]|uniref:Reverse transcriptase domain-containing protein n=1 Tax=Tanacetum coccineum TaxID=301880 RepID=A0ABQ5DSK8_9ASTR
MRSNNEIKRAVWDCGTNKSPGPDGFTFEFFRRYRKFLENGVSVAVMDFLSSGTFPECNSCFIALISKTQNAKTVKDFRLISLIGTFVSNRQILDGPVILNELLSWCKYKKFKAIVFKVDFEKAFGLIKTIKAIHGEKGAIESLDPSPRRSPWLEIVREITILRLKGIDLLFLIRKKIAEKLNHSSLVWSYRRAPRGGIEEEQRCILLSRTGGVILPNMLDRWVWSLEAS